MRALNLKFICATLFALVFLIGGFFINTTKVSAENLIEPFPYSLSAVQSYPNNIGGVTTVVNIGCVPNSGDKYDVNTGTLCPYATPGAKLGCAFKSGDKYDINTGKRCLYLTSNIFIGCASNSKDLYDINTGKPCLVVTKTSTNPPSITVNTVTEKITQKIIETKKDVNSILKDEAPSLETPILSDENVDSNNLLASGIKARPLFSRPWSARTIVLVIFLILGLGYGIYSVLRKNKPLNNLAYGKGKMGEKDKKAEAVVKPIIPQQQPQKPLEQPINTNAQSKIPNTPMTPPQNTNPTGQMPLNISNNQNNPNPQGK